MKVKYREGLKLETVHGGMLTRPLRKIWTRLVNGEKVEMAEADAREPLKMKLIERVKKEQKNGN